VKTRIAPNPSRFFDWRSYADYSGGIVADQGTHVFDGIHMLMGAGYPTAVTAAAGPVYRNGVDTPQTFVVTSEYGTDFLATFTLNYAAMRYKSVNDQLNSLDGDKARLDVGRESFNLYKAGAEDVSAMKGASGGMEKATIDHIQNFLDCVRTRATPRAPIEIGLQATLVPQMAAISARQGRRVKWNAKEYRVEI
jgi:predicted dehydrogenase